MDQANATAPTESMVNGRVFPGHEEKGASSSSGPGGTSTNRARSVADMLMRRIRATPSQNAFQYPDESSETGWSMYTWKEVGERVRGLAAALREFGLQSEQRVALLCATRVEWLLADFGVMCAGGATTTIYPNCTADECEFIIIDSGARVAFAESDEHVARLAEKRNQLSTLELVVTIDGQPGHDGWVITFDEFIKRGQKFLEKQPEIFDGWVSSIEPSHLATLIYTSGTTGRPKGVELLHSCWIFEGQSMASLGLADINDHQYLWLPLSHSFGKVLQAYQLEVGFVTTVDGRIPKLVDNLAVVRPTIMAAAPRIFEKVYNRVVTGATDSWLKSKIFSWAVKVGRQVSKKRQAKEPIGTSLALSYSLAQRLVFSKLQARFGGRIRYFVSGSAALSKDIAEFFDGAGLLVLEGYGLTETSAASFVNRPDQYKFGTVGHPLPGIEVKIDPSDNEILVKGSGVMRGYHNLPAATKSAFTEDGWFRTGDIGELDSEGRLKITDRKKDLIKTSGGKYVAPQKLEGMFKALCPYISQIVVHGNGRNFCSALVTLDEDSIAIWAEENNLSNKSISDLAKSEMVNTMMQEAFDDLNKQVARHETIKKFAVLPSDFSEMTGELTASLKVKRKVVETKYQEVLDGFYDGALEKIS